MCTISSMVLSFAFLQHPFSRYNIIYHFIITLRLYLFFIREILQLQKNYINVLLIWHVPQHQQLFLIFAAELAQLDFALLR